MEDRKGVTATSTATPCDSANGYYRLGLMPCLLSVADVLYTQRVTKQGENERESTKERKMQRERKRRSRSEGTKG